MGRRAFQTEGPVSSNLTGKESVRPPAACWRSEGEGSSSLPGGPEGKVGGERRDRRGQQELEEEGSWRLRQGVWTSS